MTTLTEWTDELCHVLFWITQRPYGGALDGTRWLGSAAQLARLLESMTVIGAPTNPRRLGSWLRRQVAEEACHHTDVRFIRHPKTGAGVIEVTARPGTSFSPGASQLYVNVSGS